MVCYIRICGGNEKCFNQQNKSECHIVIPYVMRVMQEIAIAQERMEQGIQIREGER